MAWVLIVMGFIFMISSGTGGIIAKAIGAAIFIWGIRMLTRKHSSTKGPDAVSKDIG